MMDADTEHAAQHQKEQEEQQQWEQHKRDLAELRQMMREMGMRFYDASQNTQ